MCCVSVATAYRLDKPGNVEHIADRSTAEEHIAAVLAGGEDLSREAVEVLALHRLREELELHTVQLPDDTQLLFERGLCFLTRPDSSAVVLQTAANETALDRLYGNEQQEEVEAYLKVQHTLPQSVFRAAMAAAGQARAAVDLFIIMPNYAVPDEVTLIKYKHHVAAVVTIPHDAAEPATFTVCDSVGYGPGTDMLQPRLGLLHNTLSRWLSKEGLGRGQQLLQPKIKHLGQQQIIPPVLQNRKCGLYAADNLLHIARNPAGCPDGIDRQTKFADEFQAASQYLYEWIDKVKDL